MTGYVRFQSYELRELAKEATRHQRALLDRARDEHRSLSLWRRLLQSDELRRLDDSYRDFLNRSAELVSAIEGDRGVWLSVYDAAWLRRKANK